MGLAPLRGRVLRWVPGRIPLTLHAPGKAAERAAPKPSTALSRKPATQRSEASAETREAPPTLHLAEISVRERGRAERDICARYPGTISYATPRPVHPRGALMRRR